MEMRSESMPAGDLRLIPPGSRSGSVGIPSSKSVAHRALICAAVGENPVSVLLDGLSEDILATAGCLRALGADVEIGDGEIRVCPVPRNAGSFPSGAVSLPAGESGSTLRFLLPLVGALGVDAVFEMKGRLSQRPLAPLNEVLRAHGMKIEKSGDRLFCSGKLRAGDYLLPGDVSSQYFSGLLMALPLLEGDSRLTAAGRLESSAYIRITEQVLASAGISLPVPEASDSPAGQSRTWTISGGRKPRLPGALRIEADWSNAAFFLCMGALSEAGVTVLPLRRDSAQGDREVLRLLREFGAEVLGPETGGDSGLVTVRRGEARPLRIDASGIPDLVPVLAVLCCGAVGASEITGAARLRLKESDRLQTTAGLIRSLGGEVAEHPDGLTVYGSGSLRGGVAEACNDHRIAMSAAVAACLCREPVFLRDSGCVRKSYPAFWTDFGALENENDAGLSGGVEREGEP